MREPTKWYEQPVPKRRHKCIAAQSGHVNFTWVERCACGGIRINRHGSWRERNSRSGSPPWYITNRASWWNTICLIISLNRKKS